MKNQTTQTESPKTISRNTFVSRLLENKKVMFFTIEYCSEIDLKKEFKSNKIFEVQYANIALGAKYIKRKNKIEAQLGEVITDQGELSWGELSKNRKLRFHKGNSYLHGFRLRKVRKNEGYFINLQGERLNPEKVQEMRKEVSVTEVQKRVGWRAYSVSKIRRFWFKGEWQLTD